MKLIEAEKAKDVIHEYFKSLMVNGASGMDVDRLAVGIGSCLKHDANLLKAIDELPSTEPYTIHSDGRLWITVDDIDKVNAVVVDESKSKFCKQFYMDVQPEQKTGHWIEMSSANHTYKCSECGRLLVNVTDGKNNISKHYPYCHCGAKMEGGEQDE